MLIAVNYHYIRPVFDAPHPGIHGMTPAQFEAQLKVLGRIGTFVSARQVREFVKDCEAPLHSILITFDDGLREQYEHAWPVLRRLDIPAVFFVNTAPLAAGKVLSVHKIHLLRSQLAPDEFLKMLRHLAGEQGISADFEVPATTATAQYRYDTPEAASVKYLLNFQLDWAQRDSLIDACFAQAFSGCEAAISRDLYMSASQIKELAALGCIGSHSHDHLPLGLLPAEQAAQQIQLSLSHLEDWTGARPFAMSYPYGSQAACSPQTGAIAATQGIEFAFTMERAANANFADPLLLARFDSNDVPGGKSCRYATEDFFESVAAAQWYRS